MAELYTTVTSPAIAKNCLAVGASRSVSRSSSNWYYEPRDIVIDRMTVSYKEAGTQ